MKIKKTTPKQDGFHLVSAFQKHQEAYLMWPMRPDNWRDGGKPAQKAITQLATRLHEFEPVTVLVERRQFNNARQALPESIRVLEMSYNDAFIRDSGPAFIQNDNGQTRLINWRFNAWGGLVDGLYFPWDQDDLVAKKLAELWRLDRYDIDFVLEGCEYEYDGDGTLIAVEESMLSEGRNGHVQKQQVERLLKDYFNIKKVIWLEQGYYLDETNGDVDNMVRFVKPGEVVLTWTDDKTDPQYAISLAAYEALTQATDAKGRKLKIHKFQIPTPLFATEHESRGVDPVNGLLPRYPGDRLTASYVNYFLTNNVVVLPVFNDVHDQTAIKQMQSLFPARQIIPFYCREFLLGGGNIHSMVIGLPE